MANIKLSWKSVAPILTTIVLILFSAPEGLPQHAWYYFAIFIGVIVGLILEPLPGSVVAMIGLATIGVLAPWVLYSPEQLAVPEFEYSVKALSWVVSGFSNSVIWLIFAAFMFGLGYEKTGLGRRIALCLVKKMGHSSLSLGYAVMLSELVLAPVTPSNTARGAGIIFPIIRNLPSLYGSEPNSPTAKKIGSYIMWTGITADCVTSAIFLTAMAPNLLLIGIVKSSAGVDISWATWFLGLLPLSMLLVCCVPWLIYVIYPPEIKKSPEISMWAAQELDGMGVLTWREKAMLILMISALLLWIFASSYINAAMVGYLITVIMLVLNIITWDDIISSKSAWNVFFWLASLLTLASGLNQTGFIHWFGESIAKQFVDFSTTLVMLLLFFIFYGLRYLFASATAYTSALAPMMLATAVIIPDINIIQFGLLVGASVGLGSILTPYATGPSPIYYSSGYLPTNDYWRLGVIFGLIFLVLLLATAIFWMPLVL